MRAPRGARVPATPSSGPGCMGSPGPARALPTAPVHSPRTSRAPPPVFQPLLLLSSLHSSLPQCHLWSHGVVSEECLSAPFHGRNKLSTGLMGWGGGGGRLVPAVRHCFPTPRSVRKHTLTGVCLCVRVCARAGCGCSESPGALGSPAGSPRSQPTCPGRRCLITGSRRGGRGTREWELSRSPWRGRGFSLGWT